MPRDLILGTAGHIDHGKTSLVKALTGIDTDRLPEEKARGITIDIGFARLDLGDYRLGIVDVPGHERFIKNMLAGATGVDLALLVVAADDSVMPQTREHLEILRLLGLRHGVIALTKCDLVDDTTRDVAAIEIRDLVGGTFLADAPIVPTVATTGVGISELKAALLEVCKKTHPRPGMGLAGKTEWFRLAIDRSFVLQGHGTVVTGSVTSGSVRVGDELDWFPRGQRVRVRSLHNHDSPVEEVHRGMRAAINLAGVAHEDVFRGQELATPGYLRPARTLTVRLKAAEDARRPLKHRTPVRLHLGTAEILGTVSLLDRDDLKPGEWGLAQLFLEEPAVAVWGQPFVVRESSAATTIGGGQVLQPTARKIRRRHVEVIEWVEKLVGDDVDLRALAVAWFGGFGGFTPTDLIRGAGIAPTEALPLIDRLHEQGRLAAVSLGQSRQLLLHADALRELEERVLAVVGRMHDLFPLLTALDRQKVQAQLEYVGDDALVSVAVDRLIGRRMLVGDARRLARADFKPKLSVNQRKLKDKIVAALREAGFQPPEPGSFVNQAAGNAASLTDIFEVAVAEGELARVADDLFLHAAHDTEMRRRVTAKLAAGGPGLTVADIRDILGTTRKYAVPLCEYLDRVGVTVRSGDLRVLATGKESAKPT
jgi:selenocysteine-specific elongation factor